MPKETFELIAKTFYGLEEVLAAELIELGAQNVKPGVRAVYFSGDNEIIYKANLWCRTALKILKQIKTFSAPSEEDLYAGVFDIEWEKFMKVEDTFMVEGVLADSQINHSKFAALRAKDAIADRFRSLVGSRPSVDTENPTLKIHVHISKDVCNISLDSSGDPLFKRGYKTLSADAPINEVMAAGLVLLSGWDKKSPFVDFMCGSGTLLIEAALIAKNIPPGIYRRNFAFESWNDFDRPLWEQIFKSSYLQNVEFTQNKIRGVDVSSKYVDLAIRNITNARLTDCIEIEKKSFEYFDIGTEGGTIIINPPYGERMDPDDLFDLYHEVGNYLKQKCQGFQAWILTSNMEAAKNIGLHPSKKLTLFNGPLMCKFMKFDIYRGSNKKKYLENKTE